MGEVTLIAISVGFYLLGYFAAKIGNASKIGNATSYTLKMLEYLDEKMKTHDFPDNPYGISEKIGYLKAKSDISHFSDKKETRQ